MSDMTAEQLASEIERLHSWKGLMSLLDEHWPADIFPGESDDPGPRIVALMRWVGQLQEEVERVKTSDPHFLPLAEARSANERLQAEAAAMKDRAEAAEAQVRELERLVAAAEGRFMIHATADGGCYITSRLGGWWVDDFRPDDITRTGPFDTPLDALAALDVTEQRKNK